MTFSDSFILDAKLTEAKAECERVEREAKPLPKMKRKVLWVIWDSPLMVAGAGSLADGLLQRVGVENIAGNVKIAYFKSSYELLRLAAGASAGRHRLDGLQARQSQEAPLLGQSESRPAGSCRHVAEQRSHPASGPPHHGRLQASRRAT